MGHRPKSLLELDGIPLIKRQIMSLTDAGVTDLFVVVGHYAESIKLALQECLVTTVQNPNPDAGHISSLRLGLQALPPRSDAVIVALADQPLIHKQDIKDLMDAFAMRPESAQFVQPEVNGQPGNPVMFTAQVREAILADNANFGSKQWQAAHPEAVQRWVTLNQRYCTDIDTMQDIETLELNTGHRLLWPKSMH